MYSVFTCPRPLKRSGKSLLTEDSKDELFAEVELMDFVAVVLTEFTLLIMSSS